MLHLDDTGRLKSQAWFWRLSGPAPGVAKPELRQDIDGCDFGAAIVDAHAHQQVVRRRLRVFDGDIKVAVVIEYAGVDKFVLGRPDAAPAILIRKPGIGYLGLRLSLQHLQISMARSRVE